MRKNGGVLERFLKSLLVAIFAAVVAFTPAYADDACRNLANLNDVTYNPSYWRLDTTTGTLQGAGSDANFSIWLRNVRAGYYTISANFTRIVHYANFQLRDSNNTVISNGDIFGNIGMRQYVFNVPYDGDYRVNIRVSGTDSELTCNDIQIERGSTATSYVPYNPLCATCNGTVVNYTTVTENEVQAGVQNGTPSPTNPIEPVFYKQGDMVLRRIGDYADSYDATTGKITRRIAYHVFNGAEAITLQQSHMFTYSADGKRHGVAGLPISTHFVKASSTGTYSVGNNQVGGSTNTDNISVWIRMDSIDTIQDFKQFLLDQYAAGTPVVVYYPLKEANWYTENWQSSYCQLPIKIATTAYNSARFSPVVTELNDTIATIRDVVTNTINQTKAIADLQATKQTRPDSECPAGKKCLLVEDVNGVPHWYEIIEEYIPPE